MTAEAGRQAKELVGRVQVQLGEQAGAQQKNLVAGLKALADELKSMSTSADAPGVASDVARQASERTSAVAGWLDGKEPAAIVDDMTTFARQRPGMFLGLAAGTGVIAGRLTRGLQAQAGSAAPKPASSTTPPAVVAITPAYVPPITPAAPALPVTRVIDPLEPPPAAVFPRPGYLGETRP